MQLGDLGDVAGAGEGGALKGLLQGGEGRVNVVLALLQAGAVHRVVTRGTRLQLDLDLGVGGDFKL